MTVASPSTIHKFRVLYLEDDPLHRESTRELLETDAMVAVDFAVDTADADRQVAQTQYDAILVDVDLRKTEKNGRQGDDWIQDRYGDIQASDLYIVTAQDGKIRDRKAMKKKHVTVVAKGDGEIALYKTLRARAGKAIGVSPDILRRSASPTVGDDPEAGRMIADRSLQLFYRWIDRLDDADIADIYVGSESLSPADIQRAMKDPKSPLGRQMIELYVAHIADLLGFDDSEVTDASN